MSYVIHFTPAAARQLGRLDPPLQRRIAGAVDALSEDPRPSGVKKLAGAGDLWRIRVGDYRVVYQIHDRRLIVLIVTIGHRGDVYR